MANDPQECSRNEVQARSKLLHRAERRTYQKPRVERFRASSLILGAVTGIPDGISGGERRQGGG
jgi:hypothetical protein